MLTYAALLAWADSSRDPPRESGSETATRGHKQPRPDVRV